MEATVLQGVAQFVILLFLTSPKRVSSIISPAPSGVKASVNAFPSPLSAFCLLPSFLQPLLVVRLIKCLTVRHLKTAQFPRFQTPCSPIGERDRPGRTRRRPADGFPFVSFPVNQSPRLWNQGKAPYRSFYPAGGGADYGRNFRWAAPPRIIRGCFGEL